MCKDIGKRSGEIRLANGIRLADKIFDKPQQDIVGTGAGEGSSALDVNPPSPDSGAGEARRPQHRSHRSPSYIPSCVGDQNGVGGKPRGSDADHRHRAITGTGRVVVT